MERGPFQLIDRFPMPIDKDLTMQDLLNQEAFYSNNGQETSDERMQIHTLIRLKRDDQFKPPCFGEDDCSTLILSSCPWRMDCAS